MSYLAKRRFSTRGMEAELYFIKRPYNYQYNGAQIGDC